jgi:hypothetical protein
MSSQPEPIRGQAADEVTLLNVSMEARGFYNAHSLLQAGGGTLALPFLQAAAKNVVLDGASEYVIADYGSSQGQNSFAVAQSHPAQPR